MLLSLSVLRRIRTHDKEEDYRETIDQFYLLSVLCGDWDLQVAGCEAMK